MQQLVLLVASALALAPAPQELVLEGGRRFDGETLVANERLVIRDGRITALDGARPEGVERLTLADDEVVLPGLIDLHAHYAVDLFAAGRVDERAALPALYLALGVTSTYTAGEMNPVEMRALRLAIESGERSGPRLFDSGPYFGRWRRGWDRNAPAAELVREIDHWAAQGVHCFKAKGISEEHLKVLIERAHHHGKTVTGHLDSGVRDSVNPADAIALGIDRIEHFLGGETIDRTRPVYDTLPDVDPDTDAFREVAALYIANGVYFDATLTAYGYYGERDPEVFTPWMDETAFFTPFLRAQLRERPRPTPVETFERIYRKKRETILAFFELGGGPWITVGSDHPSTGEFLAPFGVHRELHALSLAGLPNAAVLRCATINAARALGEGERLGSIEVGKLADLVIVRGNPLEDITATRNVHRVIARGRVHASAELLKSARDAIGPRSADEIEAWSPRPRRQGR